MGFKLRITKGKASGKEFSFGQEHIRVGRHHDNDLVIYDLNISRHHFGVAKVQERYVLTDLGSRNGVRVNDQACATWVLHDGDRISAGPVEFEFQAGDTLPRITLESARPTHGDAARPEAAAKEHLAQQLFSSPGSATQRQKLEELHTRAQALHELLPRAEPRPKAQRPLRDPLLRFLRNAAGRWRRTPPLGRVAGLLLLVVGLSGVIFLSLPWSSSKDFSTSAVPLSATPEPRSFGFGKVAVQTRKGAQFSFSWQGGRTVLQFTPGGILTRGQIELCLNGQKVSALEPTDTRWGRATTVHLPRKFLHLGAGNALVFRPARGERGEGLGGDDAANAPTPHWGVKDLAVVEEAAKSASIDRGLELMRLGATDLEHQKLDPQNLSRAEAHFHEALLYFEQLTPEPPQLGEAERQLQRATEALETTIGGLVFEADQAMRQGRLAAAQAALKEALGYVPTTDDPRRRELQIRLSALPKRAGDGE